MTNDYRDLPLIKPPVWTWEVPAYFFAGGAAGAAAILALAAQVIGGREELVRDGRRIAAAGAALSAPLLIADLGRPERFLNMMRVFKPRSPMSVGAWTLAIFGGAATAAAIAPSRTLRNAAGAVSAASGAVMATYTGVLIGATTVPVWAAHVRLLPVHFAASSLGTAASLLEMRGHRDNALNALALGVALFESAAGAASNASRMRLAAALSGPIPFVLRLLGRRTAAAAASVTGSLLTRFAWIEEGRANAARPQGQAALHGTRR
jgi:formate-dependent nitrite reductase membrane component NrfD